MIRAGRVALAIALLALAGSASPALASGPRPSGVHTSRGFHQQVARGHFGRGEPPIGAVRSWPDVTYDADQIDVVHVIKGVIEAETGAIEHYNQIIEFCEGKDPVTQDMVTAILHDEEGHRRLFEGFLREYKSEGLA